ncbi:MULTISPECIES: copper-binding protein [Brevundimonas]|jgi:Cu(I)/Ag(I) efflux system protein CusF|nr:MULTISPECIES: copper-binding protein [Brevundimonas]
MKYSLILATGMALGLAACNQPQETLASTEEPATGEADVATIPMTADAGAQTGTGTGVVTAIDPDAGTITVDHGPIPGVGWPAMTMRFTASPAVAESAETGERIAFDVSVRDGVNEITAIRPE